MDSFKTSSAADVLSAVWAAAVEPCGARPPPSIAPIDAKAVVQSQLRRVRSEQQVQQQSMTFSRWFFEPFAVVWCSFDRAADRSEMSRSPVRASPRALLDVEFEHPFHR
jgi:hypothetical protein